jgi:hypothetical protein
LYPKDPNCKDKEDDDHDEEEEDCGLRGYDTV